MEKVNLEHHPYKPLTNFLVSSLERGWAKVATVCPFFYSTQNNAIHSNCGICTSYNQEATCNKEVCKDRERLLKWMESNRISTPVSDKDL